MKKRYIVLSIVLAAILLLPKYISTQVRSNIDFYIAEINKINGYSVEVVEINDGWFSSTGALKVNIALADITENTDFPWGDENPEVLLEFVSHHGPVIFTDGLDIGFINWELQYEGQILREKLDWAEDTNFYQLTISTGLLGGIDLEDRIVPFSIIEESKSQNMVFSGYQGEGGQSGGEFYYEGEIESFQFTSEQGKFEIENFELSMESEGEFIAAMNGEMFDSNAALKLGKIEILTTDDAPQNVELKELMIAVETTVDESEKLVSLSQNISVESFSTMEYKVTDIKFDLDINRVSLVFLRAYQEFAKSLSGLPENEMKQQSLSFFQQNLLPLLQSEPQLNLSNLSATLDEGKIVGFSNNQLVGIEALPAITQDPKFWIEHTVSETKLELDKDVANLLLTSYMVSQLQLNPQTVDLSPEEIQQIAIQQVPVMIEGLKAQGLLVEEDDKLKLHALLKDGVALLNGNPIPLPF